MDADAVGADARAPPRSTVCRRERLICVAALVLGSILSSTLSYRSTLRAEEADVRPVPGQPRRNDGALVIMLDETEQLLGAMRAYEAKVAAKPPASTTSEARGASSPHWTAALGAAKLSLESLLPPERLARLRNTSPPLGDASSSPPPPPPPPPPSSPQGTPTSPSASSPPPPPPPQPLPPVSSPAKPETLPSIDPTDNANLRVVAYSFYGGDSPRYSGGLLDNARLLEKNFPGWHMWIYYDESAPMSRMKEAQALSPKGMIKLVDTAPFNVPNRMAWRFLPAGDATVERFIARDCDSRLTPRDKATVDAWIASEKKFHVVRDHPSHSNYPMSGGMWGAVRGALSEVQQLIKAGAKTDVYLADMNFLTSHVWPIAQRSLIQHDAFSCTRYGGGLPVPRVREGGEHLGAVYLNGKIRQGDVNILLNAERPKECTPPAEYEAWLKESPARGASPSGRGKRACDCAGNPPGGGQSYCDKDNSRTKYAECREGCVSKAGGNKNQGICVKL